jgi:hypothetical protein
MSCGRETRERVLYRFHRMADLGIRPYPMPYQRTLRLPTDGTTVSAERTLGQFQRWAVRRIYTACRFEDYDPAIRLAA